MIQKALNIALITLSTLTFSAQAAPAPAPHTQTQTPQAMTINTLCTHTITEDTTLSSLLEQLNNIQPAAGQSNNAHAENRMPITNETTADHIIIDCL